MNQMSPEEWRQAMDAAAKADQKVQRIAADMTLLHGPGDTRMVEYRAEVYDYAIARAREDTPGEGIFMRRTRGGRPVMVVHDEAGRVFAYVVRGMSTSFHGYGIQFQLGAGHLLKGDRNARVSGQTD